MNWTKAVSADYIPILCVNEYIRKYHLGFSPIQIPIEKKDEYDTAYDMKYIQVIHKGGITVDNLKQYLKDLILEYDDSNDVNYFTINNNKAVLRKSARVGLMNSLAIQEQDGKDKYTLWLETNNGLKDYTLLITDIRNMLKQLEIYAIECNNVTQSHLSNLDNLLTKEDVLNYDITQSYPEQLVFNTNIE